MTQENHAHQFYSNVWLSHSWMVHLHNLKEQGLV